jgi:hypothetical protein
LSISQLIIHICFPLQAGISENQLTLALEPEAASLYCRKVPVSVESTGDGERKISAMQKGSKYIVFDQGGILLVLNLRSIWTFQIKDNMLPNNIAYYYILIYMIDFDLTYTMV